MTVYIILRACLQESGEFVKCTIEKAFTDKSKAEEFLKTGKAAWHEIYQNVGYACERSCIECELE